MEQKWSFPKADELKRSCETTVNEERNIKYKLDLIHHMNIHYDLFDVSFIQSPFHSFHPCYAGSVALGIIESL